MNKNAFSIVVIIFCIMSLIVGIFSVTGKNTSKNKNETQNVTTSFQKNKIVLVKMNGVIDSSDANSYFTTTNTAQGTIDALNAIAKDDNAKGVIIKINTPGGTVGMSQNLYDTILKVRKLKPVVISMDDMAASGGYYISSAADRIFAQRGTLTGSIGVIFSTIDIHELLTKKLLITPNVIKSGKYKDVGSELRQMSPDERELLQSIINNSYEQFISDITKGRIEYKKLDKNSKDSDGYFEYKSVPRKVLTKDTLKKYADGRVFTGMQALELGFVDALGDIDCAHEAITKMAKERFKISDKNIPLVTYSKYQNWGDYFFNSVNSKLNKAPSIELNDYVPLSMKMAKQPLYLWE